MHMVAGAGRGMQCFPGKCRPALKSLLVTQYQACTAAEQQGLLWCTRQCQLAGQLANHPTVSKCVLYQPSAAV